tara:strand:+ start:209 stop:985 length:777 start_codon:yes stop_codon:yes gene_type:complete
MKNIDYEMIFNYISLVLAISIFIIILYTCYTKNNIEKFETEKVTATGKAIIGGVSKVEVTNGGSGVEEGTTIEFSEPEDSDNGEKAEGTATISDGKVTEIKVTKSGKGYTSAPTISFKGDGTGLETTVTLGALSHIKITNPGKGYGSVPTIDIGDAPADGVKAELTAVVTNGEITSVTVNNAGDGYNADFDVTFQSPQEAEDDSNPILSLGDKKDEVLKLLESCKKIDDDKKEKIKKNINDDTLKKLEVEELISILNK